MFDVNYFPFKKFRKLFSAIIFILFIYLVIIYLSPVKELSTVNEVKTVFHRSKFLTKNESMQKGINFNISFNVSDIDINYNIHIFYYAWYGNIEVDKSWYHWNHQRLQHWNKAIRDDFDQSRHIPPEDIGADFYPAIGLYSSRDKKTRLLHLQMIRYTGVGVIIYSWYPGNMSDPNGKPVDDIVLEMLDDAHKLKLKMALHIEPYLGRSIISIKKDLLYIYSRYSRHPAYYKRSKLGQKKQLPVVFIYDSYRISGNDWFKVFGNNQPLTIRKKKEDFFVVGLHFERDSCNHLASSGFDATYTYFVSQTNSYGSSASNWKDISQRCAAKNIEFFPSVGPGYKDISVRPWNSMAIEERRDGQFYKENFGHVRALNISSFGITSFNEWHEGTQIEPAVPHPNMDTRLKYDDYGPHSATYYLDLTRAMVRIVSGNDTPFRL